MLLNRGFTKASPTIAERLDEPGTNEGNVAAEREGGFALLPTNANEVFLHDLGEIYDAEHRFLEGQQEMVREAADQRLQSAIQEHIEHTQKQIQNLEQAY